MSINIMIIMMMCCVQRLVEQFQTDAKTRVAVLSIKAAGVVSTHLHILPQHTALEVLKCTGSWDKSYSLCFKGLS